MPSLLSLDEYTGAALIGLLLSSMCALSVMLPVADTHRHPLSVYGITLLQVYSYFVDHPETDGKLLKIFVRGLLRAQEIY
jgi:hypothetical protein